jgi:hypothetical protein
MQPVVDKRDGPQQRVSTPAGGVSPDVAVAAQKLIALLDRVEEFTALQFRRLEMTIQMLEASSGEHASPQETQVEQWMKLWEEERSAERRRLQQEGQLLIRAWKELEDEQRRLLGLRESLAVHGSMPCNSANPGPRSAEETQGVEEMALSQFQILRREIQRHARCGGST